MSRSAVETLIGDKLQDSIPTRDIFAELREKFEVFFLFAAEGSYQPEQVLDAKDNGTAMGWRDLLGQNALILEDAKAVSETIAMTVALMEGLASYDEALEDLKATGADVKAIKAAGKALATVGAGIGGSSAVIASGSLEDEGGESGAERL